MYNFPVETVLEVITNMKIVSLKDQILILLQLGDGDISRFVFALEFAPPISTHTCPNFLFGSREFYKINGDKFGWVKYWQMAFNLPNSPKFSPATILHYTVVATYYSQNYSMIT